MAVKLAAVHVEVRVGVSAALCVVLVVCIVVHGALVCIVMPVIKGVRCHHWQLLCRMEHVLRVLRFNIVHKVV